MPNLRDFNYKLNSSMNYTKKNNINKYESSQVKLDSNLNRLKYFLV